MNGISVSADIIGRINNIEELSNFLAKLGYKTEPRPLYIPGLDLPESTQKLLTDLQLIAEYDQRFQIYFGKTTTMRRTDFRNILEPFYRRYPQINSLFAFTNNWEEIAFVSPERIALEPKKAKLRLRILLVDPQNVYHTDLEVLRSISISPEEQRADIIWQKHLEAFNVEKVTKGFFEAYKFALNYIKEILPSQNKASYQEVHSFAQQFLSRIMFLYYVQKKGWLKWKDYIQDKRYIKKLWEKYKDSNSKKDTFYSLWLSSLFFQAFNKKHGYMSVNFPDEIKESFSLMPFLNGGLFTENELDKIGFEIPDEVFKMLFEMDPSDGRKGFLEKYNFTIREDTPFEVEVAVDPEMLGKVYESLISEEERGKAGIFYTPRVEIDYMCRLSIVEYLFEETKISKTKLIPLIFEPQRIVDDSEIEFENLRKIREAIDRVKIVDPAVGSASFLVGMMNVLVEIMRNLSLRVDKREENLFALKNKVLSENLYGVDVKDWAVMVGELRLWLSLIIETEEKFMDIYTKPLLPNLTFKMRQGDSLVEEIANMPISLRSKFAYIPPNIKSKIIMLVDRKVEYFSGRRSADLKEKEEIEKLENEIFKDIVSNEIKKLEDEKNRIKNQLYAPKPKQMEMFGLSPEQVDLFEREIQKLKERWQEVKQEEERFRKILDEIGEKRGKDYFLWEIDFAEVFAEKGGFDIVIGNPPYVRQEMIAFPLEREEGRDPDEWRERKRLYKEKLVQSVKMHWGESVKIDKRSDLYIYFYYHGLALLRPVGVFCFINSNSWLDVGYGASLQEFLLKNMEPVYIIDNLAKRSFAESDINTVIVLIKRPKDKLQDNIIKFVAFKKPFEEVLKTDPLIKIDQAQGKLLTDDYRLFPKKKSELLEEGLEIPEEGKEELIKDSLNLPYIGNKWGGKYLRAPEIFFKILEKGKGKLVRLGNIADIETYLNTGGADDFFIVKQAGPELSSYIPITGFSKEWRREGFPHFYIEKKFLRPFIKSPMEISNIIATETTAPWLLLVLSVKPILLEKTKAFRYILWGEQQGFNKRSGCIKRTPWWKLPPQAINPGKVMWPRLHDDYHKVVYNPLEISYTNFYALHTKGNPRIIVSILFSSFSVMVKEIFGKCMYGGGVLKTDGIDLEMIISLSPSTLTASCRQRLLEIFDQITRREIRSIFEEIGLPKPNRDYSNIDPEDASLDKVLPDRRELDKIIFEVLGLTEEEQLEVYRAVVELVKNRLVKARSIR